MKQTIEIDVPDDKVAVWKNGFIVFEDAKPPLPKTWLEFVKTQNYEKSQIITGVPEDITPQHIALIQLHKLRDCYRQGWKPDWSQIVAKYSIIQAGNELAINPTVDFNSFLSFPTSELAGEFLNNFRDLIEQAGDLI